MEKLAFNKLIPENNKIESLKYLQSGEQTKITPEIQQIANTINSSEKDFTQKIKNLISYILSIKYEDTNKEKVFRKRTASQIISDGFVAGCTDRALVFIALARAMSIPAKYIETIDLNYLENKSEKYIGHVYSEILEDDTNSWIMIDPSKKNGLSVDPVKDGRVIITEGLDSWDTGIKNMKDIKNKFRELRKNYRKKDD